MAHLTALNGNAIGKRIELDNNASEIVMGRHPDCGIVLDSGSVSRQHARIILQSNHLHIEDLKSRNGTFVNGRQIAGPTILTEGDLIRICDLEFSYHDQDSGRNLLTQKSGTSTFGVLLVDDSEEQSNSRAVTGKLDMIAGGSGLTTSTEVRYQALLEITQNLARAVELEEVLPKVLDTLFRIFVQADRAFIVLRERNDQLVPRWIKTRNEEQAESFRISRTVMREVMDTKQALLTLDASADERFEMANSVADFRIRSMVVAPLLNSDNEAIGAIQMDTLNARRRFEEPDMELLGSIASQAGVAIENAQLHEQLVQQKLVEQDLELARSVQRAFLPAKAPAIEGYLFFDFYRPAQQIGGDYYDYIELPDGRIAVIVADVVGHGVAAAMLMAKLSSETRFLLASQPDSARAISLLNYRIANMGVDKFITFLCLILDPATGKVDVINAGHMAPLWKNKDKKILEPCEEQAGVPIGILEDFQYEMGSLQLARGEMLLLYTDGINEAPNKAGDMFGIPRIQELMLVDQGDVKSIGKKIAGDVDKFIQGTEQADDMCLVAIERL